MRLGALLTPSDYADPNYLPDHARALESAGFESIWTPQAVGRGFMLPDPFLATRYHSLVVARDTLPACLEVTAWTEHNGDIDEIMGLRHRELDVQGVQFHPESILTEHGHQLLKNFLEGR